jgi:lysozyme
VEEINPRVADISHWQLDAIGKYDFEAARRWGLWGVIAKATEGTGYIDPTYEEARHGAVSAGLLFGSYHFFRPGQVKEQVELFLSVADHNGLLCLDHEDAGCSVEDVKEFMQLVEEKTGQCPVLYSGHLIKDQLGDKMDQYLAGTRLWLAQYSDEPEVQKSWDTYWLWQYTGDGKGPSPHDVPGLGEDMDINSWAGTHEELEAEWSEGKKPPMPQPGDEAPPWLAAMRAITGMTETPGSADNPKIMLMADYIGAKFPEQVDYAALYKHDDTPWCGLTVGFCMAVADIAPVFGPTDTDRWMWALAWSEWEDADRIDDPVLGCVVVTEREGGGHVTLYEETKDGYYRCRGGNQSDMVNVTNIDPDIVVALMWPRGHKRPSVRPEPDAENEAKWLQSSMNVVVPHLDPKLAVDGDIGPATENAVSEYQAEEGLRETGKADAETVEHILKDLKVWNEHRPDRPLGEEE